MLEDDACDFLGVLWEMNVQNLVKPKYQNFDFDGTTYTRISLRVYRKDLRRAHQIMESSQLIFTSLKFSSPRCKISFLRSYIEEILCMVGQVTFETFDQFKGDAKESQALYDSQILFYQIPNSSAVAVMVEIYTNDINCEFARAVLQDGWMAG